MNVVHLHESIQIYGGAEVYIQQLQFLLPKYGCNSIWVGIENQPEARYKWQVDQSGNVQILTLQELILLLRKFIDEHHIDIICIHSLFEKEVIDFCLKIKPVIKFCHSPIMVCPGRDKFWRHTERICEVKYGLHCFFHIYSEGCSNRHPSRIMKAWKLVNFEVKNAAWRYRKIIVMSDYMKQGLLDCDVDSERILVNPYFTPLVRYADVKSPRSSRRNLLFVGRLISSKGPHLLIDAVSSILKDYPDVILTLIGDGQMGESLREKVRSQGLQDSIIFLGWMDNHDIGKYMSASDIVVFPSIYPEAFGIVGIEAMMRGKPVVAFDVGGVTTWLKNEDTGLALEGGDVAALADGIKRLLSNDEMYSRLAANAYKSAVNYFTPDIHLKKLINLYKTILS